MNLQQEPVLESLPTHFLTGGKSEEDTGNCLKWLVADLYVSIEFLKDQRVPWQFLFLRDIFPQLRIDLDSDLHWLQALL